MKKRLLILTTLLVAMAAGASAAIKADTYYLTGSIASWGINEDYELVEVEAGLYKCAGVAITTSDLIKVVKSNSAGSGIGSWYPDGMDNNQKVTEDGTYTVYFRPAGDGTEADGYTYIPHGSDADAHGCTNGGYMFKFVETPVAAGTYYLYNPYSGKFLSRGSAGGTRAVADDYGFPINVTFDSEGAYTLDNYDGTGAYGDDYWMYADCKGTRVRTFTLEYQKMKEHVNIPYGIKILGKEIDSSNCGDFTVEGLTGTVTYDPDSKTLTLTDVTIHNEGETNCIRNEEVDGLTINVVSDSKLTSKSNGWGGHLYKEGYYYNG